MCNCDTDTSPTDPTGCFNYLQKEFIKYLTTLSVEEYVRISAYFDWKKDNNGYPVSIAKSESHYYHNLDGVRGKKKNCIKRTPVEALKLLHKDTVSHVKDITQVGDKLWDAISSKWSTEKRLKIGHEFDVIQNIFRLYPHMKEAINKKKLDPKIATELIQILEQSTDFPNMFEYFLKCYIYTMLETKHND